ncbi:MAG: hypothetical protein P1V97_11920 [Planctomycetota bacterium]|nr:hypothetical protein [Planctomycetota bacterium]
MSTVENHSFGLIRKRESELACPYCHGKVRGVLSTTICSLCDATHHSDCYEGFGGCSVFQCPNSPTLRISREPEEIPDANADLMYQGSIGFLGLVAFVLLLPFAIWLLIPVVIIGVFILIQALVWMLPSLFAWPFQALQRRRDRLSGAGDFSGDHRRGSEAPGSE